MGVGLAASIIVRRHFLVAVFSFLVAAAATTILAVWPRCPPRQACVHAMRRVGAVAATGLVATCVLAAPFVRLLWRNNFYDLYASYLVPRSAVAASFCGAFGYLVVAATVIGFVVGLGRGLLRRHQSLFVLMTFILTGIIWCTIVRQIGVHYVLHVAPLAVFGLHALARRIAAAWPPMRAWASVSGGAFLLASLAFALTAPLATSSHTFASLLPSATPPLVRTDRDAIRKLLEDLRAQATHADPILVVASSETLSPDLLRRAEVDLFGRDDANLEFLPMPQVDSRDPYPMPELQDASYVVLAAPLQLHLPPGEQKVVSLTDALFQQGLGLARDFEPVASYALERGVVATALRRRGTSTRAQALSTLFHYERGAPHPSASQPDWVILGRPHRFRVARVGRGVSRLILPATPGASTAVVAVHAPGLQGRLVVSGRIVVPDTRCPGVEVALGPVLDSGLPFPTVRVVRRPQEPEAFSASLTLMPDQRLALTLTTNGHDEAAYCTTQLEDVRVE
jgi:hypothetical protein